MARTGKSDLLAQRDNGCSRTRETASLTPSAMNGDIDAPHARGRAGRRHAEGHGIRRGLTVPQPRPTPWLLREDAPCWQCGAPARPELAYTFVLYAAPRRHLDGLGHAVLRGRSWDRVKIRVPRCVACRARNRAAVALSLGSALAGAIVGTILQATVWRDVMPPAGVVVGHEGIGNTGTGIGAVLGLLAPMPLIALRRRGAGLRPLNTYPPVLMLREAGWHDQSG
jgi:hypothetical protein